LPERERSVKEEAVARTFVYPAKFEGGEKPGVLVITFRDIPEAIAQGNGERDALWQAADCLEEAIAGRIADGREIPNASKAARGERATPVPAPMAAKAALYLAMREAAVSNVQLARKLGCDEKEVRRMLDPRHPTKLPRIKEALDALGKRLVVSVEEAA
jgi:antitoxin HicB